MSAHQSGMHPQTLLGAARLTLARAESIQSLRLKAHAALRLGYEQQALQLWERLAAVGDAEAQERLRVRPPLQLGR
ncbi:hypothetical protein [Comamonas composti]|uniref:hypothetical protein n=1 Tax=Comamonas composti TaxID=408558 RepID=UPI00047E13EB|nr:hypothetical protein [Comamonas composti]